MNGLRLQHRFLIAFFQQLAQDCHHDHDHEQLTMTIMRTVLMLHDAWQSKIKTEPPL